MTEANKENLTFVLAIADKLKLDKKILFNTIQNFKGLRYRQQIVYKDKGLTQEILYSQLQQYRKAPTSALVAPSHRGARADVGVGVGGDNEYKGSRSQTQERSSTKLLWSLSEVMPGSPAGYSQALKSQKQYNREIYS